LLCLAGDRRVHQPAEGIHHEVGPTGLGGVNKHETRGPVTIFRASWIASLPVCLLRDNLAPFVASVAPDRPVRRGPA
jgi:hypothetical protein